MKKSLSSEAGQARPAHPQRRQTKSVSAGKRPKAQRTRKPHDNPRQDEARPLASAPHGNEQSQSPVLTEKIVGTETPPKAALVTTPSFGPTGHPMTRVAVAISIAVAPESAFLIDNRYAVELHALVNRLGMSAGSANVVQGLLAREAQVEQSSLPVVCFTDERQLTVAILAPAGDGCEQFLLKTQSIREAIVKSLRSGVEVVQASLAELKGRGDGESRPGQGATVEGDSDRHLSDANVGDRTEMPEDLSSPPRGDAPTESGTKPQHLNPITKRLSKALLSKSGTGAFEISFVSGGIPDPRPPLTFTITSKPDSAAKVTHGEARPLRAVVGRQLGPGTCELKEEGSTKRRTARFASDGKLAVLLRLLAHGPAVDLIVCPYVSSDPDAQPQHAYLIKGIAGLPNEWRGEFSPLDHLQDCIDDLMRLAGKPVSSR